MKFFSLQTTAMVLALSTNLLAANISNADLAEPSPLWERPISHVYVCSDTESISSKIIEDFYAEVPQVSAQFYDGWNEPNDEKAPYDDVVIVAIALQDYSSDLEACLEEINFFQSRWLEGMAKQAKVVGTVPEFLANSSHGQYFHPLGASWAYRYDNRVIFASYIYQNIEQFSYEDAVRGALQFQD